ncbi:NGG1p interacting factor NIF3 [Candidatus Comchoanobacter bicostacola]
MVFYVPDSHTDAVKEALFAAGGGVVGSYQKCCWQVLGTGQFVPDVEAHPSEGSPGVLSRVAENRVELLIQAQHKDACVAALKLAHPYECPVFYFLQVEVE